MGLTDLPHASRVVFYPLPKDVTPLALQQMLAFTIGKVAKAQVRTVGRHKAGDVVFSRDLGSKAVEECEYLSIVESSS